MLGAEETPKAGVPPCRLSFTKGDAPTPKNPGPSATPIPLDLHSHHLQHSHRSHRAGERWCGSAHGILRKALTKPTKRWYYTISLRAAHESYSTHTTESYSHETKNTAFPYFPITIGVYIPCPKIHCSDEHPVCPSRP